MARPGGLGHDHGQPGPQAAERLAHRHCAQGDARVLPEQFVVREVDGVPPRPGSSPRPARPRPRSPPWNARPAIASCRRCRAVRPSHPTSCAPRRRWVRRRPGSCWRHRRRVGGSRGRRNGSGPGSGSASGSSWSPGSFAARASRQSVRRWRYIDCMPIRPGPVRRIRVTREFEENTLASPAPPPVSNCPAAPATPPDISSRAALNPRRPRPAKLPGRRHGLAGVPGTFGQCDIDHDDLHTDAVVIVQKGTGPRAGSTRRLPADARTPLRNRAG